VDVNVHPAKTEVKFSQEKPVFEAVYVACKNAIMANDNMPRIEHKDTPAPAARPQERAPVYEQQRFAVAQPALPPAAPAPEKTGQDVPDLEDFLVAVPPRAQKPRSFGMYAAAPRILQDDVSEPRLTSRGNVGDSRPLSQFDVPEHTSAAPTGPSAPVQQPVALQTLEPLDSGARVIGECFHTYLIAEDKDGLILIDKHAAHERILFNKLRAETEMPQQELLTPVVVELTGEEAAAIQAQLEDIRKAGFSIDPFGENSFAVRSVPAYLDSGDVQSVISELAEKAMSSRATVPDRLDDLIHTVACKAAVKAGKPTSMTELQDLCDRVLGDENVRSCPHGRPTTVRLTKYELDKLFKRVNQ